MISSSHEAAASVKIPLWNREVKLNALFGLQLPGGEPAHRQAVHQLEGKLAGGVVPARQLEDLVPQTLLAEAFKHLLRVYGQECRIVPRPNQQRRQVASGAAAPGSSPD